MSWYSELLHDRPVQLGGPAIIVAAATPFLSAAATGIPSWANWVIAAAVLMTGGGLVAWRARRVSESPGKSESVEAEETKPATQTDADRTEESPQVALRTQGEAVEVAPPNTDREEGSGWKIVEASVRSVPAVSGEGPIVLMGYAEVAAEGDNEHKKLYYCSMFNVEKSQYYYEFRIASRWERILRRECQVRLLPGEVVAYERTWPSEGEPFNNILCDWKSAKDETLELIAASKHLVFIWTDTVEYQNGQQETKTRRIVVTTDGLSDVADRFRLRRAMWTTPISLF